MRSAIFKPGILSLLGLALSLTCVSAQQRPHTLTGDIRYHKNFHSKVLNNDRDIIVYLPPGYETNKNKRFSVFYMHDGQNLFDGATSFIPGQEWKVDETAQSLINAHKIEPLIVVGIYNTGKDRVNEYTPAQDPKYKAGGNADLYARMLVEELKPFIDRTYRTKPDAAHTGLGGSSLGGLVSLYLGLTVPGTEVCGCVFETRCHFPIGLVGRQTDRSFCRAASQKAEHANLVRHWYKGKP
jgi:enterochelin esterase-like enzyme